MAFTWRLQRLADHSSSGQPSASPSFASQSDAESWLGENWRELAATGVEDVVLVEDGTDQYEMSLAPE